MGLNLLPEVKMARKLIEKHSLKVPFDLDILLNRYAKVIYKSIPVDGVDGICLNLKTSGKTPTVIVNADSPRTRQKFTLAHELGHIIIPWHLGTFIDDIDADTNKFNNQYWELEKEANKFASELLMPFEWIYSLYKANNDRAFLLSQIRLHCGVSEVAAGIRLSAAIGEIENLLIPVGWLSQLYREHGDLSQVQKLVVEKTKLHPRRVADYMVQHLSGNITFCIESEEIVSGCGSTRDSHYHYQREGDIFLPDPYPYYESHSLYGVDSLNTHWWVLDTTFNIPDDTRTWREILEKITSEISLSQSAKSFKITINSKLSGASGMWRRKNPNLGAEDFIKDAIQRFNNPDFKNFISHPDFLVFIKKRAEAFFE